MTNDRGNVMFQFDGTFENWLNTSMILMVSISEVEQLLGKGFQVLFMVNCVSIDRNLPLTPL